MRRNAIVSFLKPQPRPQKKIRKYVIFLFLISFCILFFAGASAAISYLVNTGITNDHGAIDTNTPTFQETAITPDIRTAVFDAALELQKRKRYDCQIRAIRAFGSKNADAIVREIEKDASRNSADRMIAAIDLGLQKNALYLQQKTSCTNQTADQSSDTPIQNSGAEFIFPWQSDEKGVLLQSIVKKDKDPILQAAQQTGTDPRLLVSILFVEQARIFWTEREFVKSVLRPLGLLSTGSNISLGTMNIKPKTATAIEAYARDTSSPFYPGDAFAHLLDFQTDHPDQERIKRLTDYHNHYYSYLYTALYIKEYEAQWSRAGFPIDDRPEILATLFNIGFDHSHPNATPNVGGSTLTIEKRHYTFGGLAYEFYYSGALADDFPLR